MAENHYDLDYTGSMVDRILDTGYDLQNQGYIFRGLASHYTGTPTERTWLIAPTGSTGFGLSSPVPPGSIGICMYNGSSWSAEVLNTLTLDSAPTTGSGNGITSGAVKTLAESITNAIGQLEQSVSDRFTSLELEDTTGSLQAELLSITLKYVFEGETEPLTSISILAATAEKAGLMSSADKQKLDSLIDNIRSIRLVDVTASADKGSQMDLSLKWTVNNTEEMLTYLTLLAATTNTAGLMSAADKAKLDRLNIVGCQYAGIATPSTTPLVVDAKMFYIAVQGGNYSNFGLTVPEGISILKNEGYGWAIENLVRIDDQPTDGSAGIARSGGTFSMISTESAARESADATLSAAVVAEQNARMEAIQKEETARKAAIQEEKNAREHADDMMIHEIETFEQGVRDTVAEYKPIVIQGDVQNAPDEVDLTSTPDNLLKFKDNIYNPVLWSGMGRIYLRKNIIPESENYPFDGFVNDVPTEGELEGEPDAVLWDRINTVFVGKKNDVYYEAWTGCENYVPARQDVIYMYDGTPYVWDGDDFAVDEDVVPNLKNILTEDMMPYGNTIYVIRWDYYLNGDVTVPDNCILEFDGGSINGNYTITGQNTGINAKLVKIFSSDVILDGTWNAVEAYPEWFGAKGDGATDDTTALQKAVESFGNVLLSSTYNISTLTIDNDGMVLSGGTLISNNSGDDTAEIGIVRINSDNVAVRNISIIGNYDETSDTNIIGILVKGEFYGSEIVDEEGYRVIKRKVMNVCIEDCSISAVKYAIYLDVVESCTVSDNTIFSISYSGITALTCYDSTITNNRVMDINTDGQYINSYGVCISQHSGNYPYSVGVVVSNNIVKNNPYWEAYDTHSGKKISFISNIAENVAVGVMLTRSGNSEFSKEPGECVVSGNILNGNLRTNYAGITIVGTPEISGVLDTVLAKGITVTGNNISNFDRGIYGYCTENIVVSENNIYKCNVGLNFDSFNSSTIIGNHIEIDDMLSDASKYCIYLDHRRIDNKKNATITIQANTLKFVGYNSNNTGDRILVYGTYNNRNNGDIIDVRNNYMATVRSAEEKAEDVDLGIDRCHRWFGTNDVEGKIVNVFRYADIFGVCRYRYSNTTVPANGSVVLFKSGPLFEGQVNMLKEVIHVRDAEGITFRIFTQDADPGEETKVVAYNNTGNAINMLFGDIFMYFKGRPFILYKEE